MRAHVRVCVCPATVFLLLHICLLWECFSLASIQACLLPSVYLFFCLPFHLSPSKRFENPGAVGVVLARHLCTVSQWWCSQHLRIALVQSKTSSRKSAGMGNYHTRSLPLPHTHLLYPLCKTLNLIWGRFVVSHVGICLSLIMWEVLLFFFSFFLFCPGVHIVIDDYSLQTNGIVKELNPSSL